MANVFVHLDTSRAKPLTDNVALNVFHYPATARMYCAQPAPPAPKWPRSPVRAVVHANPSMHALALKSMRPYAAQMVKPMKIVAWHSVPALVSANKVNANETAIVLSYTTPSVQEASPIRINALPTVPMLETLSPVNAVVIQYAIQMMAVVVHAIPRFDASSTNVEVCLVTIGVSLCDHADKPVMRVNSNWRACAMRRPARKSLR